MSRGYGKVQRFILDTLRRTSVESEYGPPLRAWPVPALATAYVDHLYASGQENAYVAADWSDSPSVRYAVTRARRQLARDSAVDSWEVLMSTQLDGHATGVTRRRVLLVGLPGLGPLTHDDVEDAEALMFYQGRGDRDKDYPTLVAEHRAVRVAVRAMTPEKLRAMLSQGEAE